MQLLRFSIGNPIQKNTSMSCDSDEFVARLLLLLVVFAFLSPCEPFLSSFVIFVNGHAIGEIRNSFALPIDESMRQG